MAQAPGTPTKDMKECYPGTPIVGSPGREKNLNGKEMSATNPTCVDIAKVSMLESSSHGGNISVKGTVEKTATLGRMNGSAGKPIEFFAVNLLDDDHPPHKVRVSAFAEDSKWWTMFTAGSRLLIEHPCVGRNTKYWTPGAGLIKFELRLMKYTKVSVEHDNTPSIEDMVNQKIADGKSVSVAGTAMAISELITMGSEDGKLMPSYDRELELSSPTGTKISVLLHGQTAKNISCDEVGAEVCFGPMKLMWNEREKDAYLQSIPFESRRCDREGKTYVIPKKEDIKEDAAKPAEEPVAKTAEAPGDKKREVETVDLTADNVEEKEVPLAKKHDIEDVENAEKKPAVTKEDVIKEDVTKEDVTKDDVTAVAVKIEPDEKKRGGRRTKKDM